MLLWSIGLGVLSTVTLSLGVVHTFGYASTRILHRVGAKQIQGKTELCIHEPRAPAAKFACAGCGVGSFVRRIQGRACALGFQRALERVEFPPCC